MSPSIRPGDGEFPFYLVSYQYTAITRATNPHLEAVESAMMMRGKRSIGVMRIEIYLERKAYLLFVGQFTMLITNCQRQVVQTERLNQMKQQNEFLNRKVCLNSGIL